MQVRSGTQKCQPRMKSALSSGRVLYDRSRPPSLPSDLAGIAAATFEPPISDNLEAALGAACTKIQRAVERVGPRENKGLKSLAEATESVEGVGAAMHTLLRLLARSRKVELDIISAQFGPLIDPKKLQQMKDDLRDLDRCLEEDGGLASR